MEEGAEDIVSRLVEAVFDEMVAPGCEPGRAEEPRRHIAPDPLLGGQRSGESFTLGAEKAGELVGVFEVRGDGRIRPFFVRADQRGKGIARRMFPVAGEGPRRAGPHPAAITANSSPRAVPIHESLVFSVALPEQVKKGIRHTLMTHRIRQPGQRGRACPPIPPSQTLCAGG